MQVFLTEPRDTKSLAIARSGLVSDAHCGPFLHTEESRRPLLDPLILQFGSPVPLGPQKLGHMMPQHVYAIRRECVIDLDTQAPFAKVRSELTKKRGGERTLQMFASTSDEEKNV